MSKAWIWATDMASGSIVFRRSIRRLVKHDLGSANAGDSTEEKSHSQPVSCSALVMVALYESMMTRTSAVGCLRLNKGNLTLEYWLPLLILLV